MKKLFSIMMVAFALTAMVACDKEDNGDGSNGGNNNNGVPTLNIADNTMVYDGVTYPLRATGLLTAESADGDTIFSFDAWHTPEAMWGKTINLVSPAENDSYGFMTWGSVLEMQCSCYWEDDAVRFYGIIDGHEYDNECVFTKGTFGIYGDGDTKTIILDCVLKNGKTLQLKFVSI